MSFSSPCLQVGCLHDDEPSTVMTGHTEREQGRTGPSAFLPDPAQSIKPRSERSVGTRLRKKSDKHVPMRCYRPGRGGEDAKFKVLVSDTPVLITNLRPTEQNIAYETVLANAPADKINEYYSLHLLRLKGIREAIVAREVVMERFQTCYIRHHVGINGVREAIVAKGMARYGEDLRADVEEGGGMDWRSEEDRVREGFLAFRRAMREMKKLRACERAVARLLVKCEDEGKGEVEFRKVVWQAS